MVGGGFSVGSLLDRWLFFPPSKRIDAQWSSSAGSHEWNELSPVQFSPEGHRSTKFKFFARGSEAKTCAWRGEQRETTELNY